jgi:hypothetical protein
LLPSAVDAAPLVLDKNLEKLSVTSLVEKMQMDRPRPMPRRRRRWVCWWRHGRRVCRWRWR